MLKLLLCIGLTLFLVGCSKHPSYEHMQSHFEDNRATFSMIAAVACEIGQEKDVDKLIIRRDSSKSEALLELAETVDVEKIVYLDKNDKCMLSMPVYDAEDESTHQQFAYSYNLSAPRQYKPSIHAYDNAKNHVTHGKTKQVMFDMKLARRWFFSFLYKDVS